MSFIKRIGTEDVHFNIEIHLQKLSLNINAPDCLVHILFQRGDRKIQTHQPALLQNKIAIFNEVLSLPITLYNDIKKKSYQEKNGFLYVLLQGARGIKKAGEITLEFSQYPNKNIYQKQEILALQKCPDPQANLQVQIVLNSNNSLSHDNSSQDKLKRINLSQMSHVQTTPDSENEIGNSKSPSSSTKDRKQTGYPKKKKVVTHERPISINLIESLRNLSPISNQLRGKEEKQFLYTENEIGSQSDFLETKEELKYLKIEMGQQKNIMAKLKTENSELNDKLEQMKNQRIGMEGKNSKLEDLFDASQSENRQLQEKLQKSKYNLVSQDTIQSPQGQNYGSNVELQQMLMENKKLKDSLNKIQKEKETLQEIANGTADFNFSGRSSGKSDDDKTKLQQKIVDLELRLQNDPNTQENKISRLTIENQQLKRKLQDVIDRHSLELTKLGESNEDSTEEAIRSYREQVETFSSYKEKYENMNFQCRKNQSDLETLRSSNFDLQDLITQKDLYNQQLGFFQQFSRESDLLKVKQNIAGAMTEFLNHGDPYAIEVMEYFMT